MASTYSADLRIELIGAGEQAGTWGSTTNTNLGTLVEDAIAGAVTVAVAATPRALTALNGAVDEARQATLILTTSTGAAFTVYAPPVSKQYVIYNNTAYVATIGNATVVNGTTSTGGTTVAIPAGKIATVWSDGTNIASSNTYLPNTPAGGIAATNVQAALNELDTALNELDTEKANIASPTFTGIPAAPTAASGTSTTQLATTAFANSAFQGAYPVGSIYMNASNATNPATLLGFGTWAALGAGRVLIGNGGAFSAGATGGSADATLPSHTHTATVSDPGHSHTVKDIGRDIFDGGPFNYNATNYDTFTQTATSTTGISVSNSSAGVSGTNANLQPYLVVYIWNRTA